MWRNKHLIPRPKEMDGKIVRGPDRGPAFRIQVSVARPAVENDKKRIREEVKTRGSNVSRDRPDNSYGRYGHDSFDRQAKAPRLSNVALIQMEDLASAVSVLQYYTTIQPSVRGRNVYLQFSSHQELTTDQSSHGRNPDQFRQVIEKDFVNENLWPELIPQVEASNPEQQYA